MATKLLAVGDRMPDVTLRDPEDLPIRLLDLVRGRGLVVYFYPKDDTPGCTIESCNFRDQYEDFVTAGADVVGISAMEKSRDVTKPAVLVLSAAPEDDLGLARDLGALGCMVTPAATTLTGRPLQRGGHPQHETVVSLGTRARARPSNRRVPLLSPAAVQR